MTLLIPISHLIIWPLASSRVVDCHESYSLIDSESSLSVLGLEGYLPFFQGSITMQLDPYRVCPSYTIPSDENAM